MRKIRPVTRATSCAQRLITRVRVWSVAGTQCLDCARAINANEIYAFRIADIRLFGSLLTDAATVGDVDLAIRLEPRFSEPAFEAVYRQRQAACPPSRSTIERAGWPMFELYYALKGRSPVLSLHEDRDLDAIGAPWTAGSRRPALDSCSGRPPPGC